MPGSSASRLVAWLVSWSVARLVRASSTRPPWPAAISLTRSDEIRRLAVAVRQATRALIANRDELAAIVADLVPVLPERPGIGPVSATHAVGPGHPADADVRIRIPAH